MSVPRLVLRGVDGTAIPLWQPGVCRDGVKLTARPDVDFTPVRVLSEAAVGQIGATPRGVVVEPRQLTLALRVEGRRVEQTVGQLFDVLGCDGRTAWLESSAGRRLGIIFQTSSQIEWQGDPADPVAAVMEVEVEVPRPVWDCGQTSYTWTEGGVLSLPVTGPRPVWPTITLSGEFTSVTVGWEGTSAVLPHRPGGYRVVTDPNRRLVTNAAGDSPVPVMGDMVPHWTHPPTPRREGRRLYLDLDVNVVGAGTDFQITIDATGEANRAWT